MTGYTLTILDVDDYGRWKAGFDASEPMRRANGEGKFQTFQSIDNPNQVVVLVEWADVEVARAAMAAEGLKDLMIEAGVHLPIQALFLTETDAGNV